MGNEIWLSQILPARTRGLGWLGWIVGSLLRYVWLFVANSNQSRSASIRAPNFYLLCQFLLYLSVGIWQCFSQCTSVLELTTQQLTSASGDVCSLSYTKWYWVFLSGSVVLNCFRGLFFVIVLTQSFFILGLRLFHSLQIVNVVWLTLRFPYVLLINYNVNQMIYWSSLL